MIKSISCCLALFTSFAIFAQTGQSLQFNQEYKTIPLGKLTSQRYQLTLSKNGIYQFSILQQGIAVHILLINSANKPVFESDVPNDIDGYEKFEYSPTATGIFTLAIARYDDAQNTDSGKITVFVKSLSGTEIITRQKIKKELVVENAKNLLTADIDHFWEAFDNLKNCKSFTDSANSFQLLYLDRATDGLIDFISVRDLQSEKYTQLVAKYPKFYNSLRNNSFEVKKSAALIDTIFGNFKAIYPNFKPFKVCFAMGIMNTGGTISNNFVLVGTEITASSKLMDLSEFDNNEYRKIFEGNEDLIPKIKTLIAHECVHTQQPQKTEPNAIKCELLYRAMREGFCDFIAELVAGNKKTNDYGDAHENKIWTDFKNELCNENSGNWLYNYSSVKDKPADLGYYIGYKIAQEYYKNAVDKKQAVSDIIEMSNPIRFLELSKYDQKEKL
jgi:Predicted Zn-dependent protease (DUF2268)